MGAAPEADRTLFVGNLDSKVTEELLFELFLQAGPLVKVKIPKDKDGKPKQFAFVNFKHEESAPYGMQLLNGIRLFGRPLKIQFRSGSSHVSQEGNSPTHPQCTSGPSNTSLSNRYDCSMGPPGFLTPQMFQRSFSSPDSLQRQAVMNSTILRQQHQFNGMPSPPLAVQSNFVPPVQQTSSHAYSPNANVQMQWRVDTPPAQRKNRHHSHPYHSEGRPFNREQHVDAGSDHHYRGSRDDYYPEDGVHNDRGRDYTYRRHNPRDGRWRSNWR
ncbi:RNA-binding protein 7 [Latimeria chalumnae]|uniref:RNA binding motif protein 7 n=1 Tax=Latimeria chalumnae TaxID=7897 RepID=H3BH25_LATCH|nr:PREDICTED: RNA-binding protein 7 [Latimeria chalumnae]|eukprot:XP_005988225.1 PREDICTED: RNA-binding protein 7 [Latimeria chalumnae]